MEQRKSGNTFAKISTLSCISDCYVLLVFPFIYFFKDIFNSTLNFIILFCLTCLYLFKYLSFFNFTIKCSGWKKKALLSCNYLWLSISFSKHLRLSNEIVHHNHQIYSEGSNLRWFKFKLIPSGFSTWLYQFISITSSVIFSVALHLPQLLVSFSLFNFSSSGECVVIFHYDLNFNFLD